MEKLILIFPQLPLIDLGIKPRVRSSFIVRPTRGEFCPLFSTRIRSAMRDRAEPLGDGK